jgi:hypothetical protein
MPFLTGPRFIENPEQLQLYRPFTRLHPLPPVRPSTPAGLPQRDTDPQWLTAPSRAADDVVAVPEAERVGGLSVQLDIGIERRRSFWWRLSLSLVARRLGRWLTRWAVRNICAAATLPTNPHPAV